MPPDLLLAIYCGIVIAASVVGGWLPEMVRMTHLRTQLMMSFVAGLMLGIALLHLLPHALLTLEPSKTGAATLAGVIGMFLLLRLFHTHAHQHTDSHQHSHDHHDDHDHDHVHPDPEKGFGWLGMLFGMGLHTLMDGVAIAASVAAGEGHNEWLGLVGLGTFLAVTLHKPLDAFAITSVMKKGGWSASQLNFVNLAFSLACPIGAVLFYFGANQWANSDQMLGWGLAISAGFFICIALSDLLPEVSFHDHDRLKLTGALLLGVALAVGIESLPGHAHEGHEHQTVMQQESVEGQP